jgi:hypothetical protein
MSTEREHRATAQKREARTEWRRGGRAENIPLQATSVQCNKNTVNEERDREDKGFERAER